tara:strand:+ start:6789 stop:7853 length:1065 start_codon:yes stop_codon:yes gene_type:complete
MEDLEKSQKKSQNYPLLDSGKKKLKYSCEACDYNTSNKTDFRKHISTPKHDSKWIVLFSGKITENEIKNKHFSCERCKHITCNLSDFEAHKNEHKNEKKVAKKVAKNEHQNRTSITKKYICEFCDRSYKYDTGYYKHVKKCTSKDQAKDKLIEMQQEVIESKTQTISAQNEIITILKDTSKVINNNTYNQSVNINLFLNEECKNAMNLTDFLSKVQMTLADLAYTKDNGMIKGITNIVIKNLADTPPTERPIHSIKDEEGSQLYIKEDDTWACENKEEKIEKTIDSISKKQCNLIKLWEKDFPDWNKTEQGTEEYMEICRIVMGGTTDTELEKTRDLILKRIPRTNISRGIKDA